MTNHPLGEYQYQDGILFFVLREGLDLGWNEADEITTILMAESAGKPVCILVDARKHFQVKEDGRRYFSRSDYPSNLRGAAVVSELLPIRMIFNFYMRINKPPYPTRLFSSIEEARLWLKKHLDA